MCVKQRESNSSTDTGGWLWVVAYLVSVQYATVTDVDLDGIC